MTIESDRDYWEVHCDFCPFADSWDRDMFPDFRDLWAECRRAGWTAKTEDDGETWEHSCPSCQEEKARQDKAFWPKVSSGGKKK